MDHGLLSFDGPAEYLQLKVAIQQLALMTMLSVSEHWQCNAGRHDEILEEIMKTEAEMLGAALQLSRQRRAAVQPLKEAVESCLADLAMPGSCFDIAFRWESACEVFISAMTFSASLTSKTSSGGQKFCMSSGACKSFVKVTSALVSSN